MDKTEKFEIIYNDNPIDEKKLSPYFEEIASKVKQDVKNDLTLEVYKVNKPYPTSTDFGSYVMARHNMNTYKIKYLNHRNSSTFKIKITSFNHTKIYSTNLIANDKGFAFDASGELGSFNYDQIHGDIVSLIVGYLKEKFHTSQDLELKEQ